METRSLGSNGVAVSALGLGCMGMSEFYGPHSERQSLATLARALDIGVTFWDTADVYGPHHNERLVGRALQGARDRVTLATKFGIVRDGDGAFVGIDGTPEYVQRACDASLKRLRVDHIDLYYQHRVDPAIPIEETVGAMARLVETGKVRYLGLSEASAATLHRASSVHPIHALQTEYSLWTRDVEESVLPACRELGIALVAYSPLGRGFLSGQIETVDALAADDWRRSNPRFQGEHFARNLELLEVLRTFSKARGCTPAQLALAWLLAQGSDVIPIPGTRRSTRLDENASAASLRLSEKELAGITEALPAGVAAGTRYGSEAMQLLNG